MSINPFLNSERQLRNGWWVLIFFLVLAALLVPTLVVAQQNSMDVSIGLQAAIIAVASWICQLLRRKLLAELLGKFNMRWFKELCLGGLVGAALMLFPALIMRIFGWIDWQWNPTGLLTLASIVLLFAGVAVAEELLFRGFIFQ
jgi:membrane protease YdiL (CAAX protease family)